MSDSSGREYVDSRGDSDDDLITELLQTISKANRLRHLYDVFRGELEDPSKYYENNGKSFSNSKRWASYLSSEFPEKSIEFMNRADAEFSHHRLKRNAVVDFLANEGIPRSVSEELDPSWTELLLLTYHTLYDQESGKVSKYNLLLAKSRLFRHRSKLTYEYDDLDFLNLSGRVDDFVRSHNKTNSRPLSIKCHQVDGSEYILDFYQESVRVANPQFDIRDEDEDADPLQPNIKYNSTYSIKSLSANLSGEDGHYEVTYSKSPSKWKTFLQGFLDTVFDISDPFDDENRKRTDSVESVLKSAFEAIEEDDASDEDVIENVDTQLDNISEETTASEATEESDYDPDELESIYDSLELVGINVSGAEETLTDTFQVSSTATLRDWTNKNVSAEDSLIGVIEEAEPDSVGFIFRGYLRGEDSPPEEFILQNGVWKSAGGGVSDEANETLNLLFQSNDE